MSKTRNWMVLEKEYQISLELWKSNKNEYFLVALGGTEEDRERLVKMGGQRQKLFGSRIEGGVRVVSFPPAQRTISTQQWLEQFPKAYTEERTMEQFFLVRPNKDGSFSDETVRGVAERAAYWAEQAAEAQARRAAAEQVDDVPFFDEVIVASEPQAPAQDPAPAIAQVLEAVPEDAAPETAAPEATAPEAKAPEAKAPEATAAAPAVVEPVAEAPVESAEAEPVVEAVEAEPEQALVPAVPESAQEPIDAPVVDAAVELAAVATAEAAPAVEAQVAEVPPVAPQRTSSGVVADFLEAIHEGDDRPIARLTYDKMAMTDEEVASFLASNPSGLLLRSRGVVVPAQIIEQMPFDMQGVLMLLGRAANLEADVGGLLSSGSWPVVGGAWGKPFKGMDRLVLFLDGTLPPAQRVTDLKSLPTAESEAAMADVINELWRTTYGQVGEIVQAAAALPKSGSTADVGTGAAAGGVQGVQREAVVGRVEGPDDERLGEQASVGAGQGRAEGAGSARAGAADAERQRAGRDSGGRDAGTPGVGAVQPGTAAGVADRDDSGLPGGDVDGGRGAGVEAGRGRGGDGAADRAERQGAARDDAGRAGDARGVGTELVTELTPAAAEAEIAEAAAVEAEAVEAAAEAEALTDEEAEVINGRMAERRLQRTARLMSVESDDSRQDYVPASALTAQGVKVPVNLASATARALSRVQEAHGDIDVFVAQQLGFDRPEALEGRLYAEQVDAIALAITSMARGRELVLGDLTGIGKGRVLASLIRFAERQDVPVIFVTKDITLFNSMGREMAVLGGEHLLDSRRLLITNSNGVIVNEQGDTIVKAPSAGRMREIWASGEMPEGVRLVFTTHSQLSEVARGDEPAGWSAERANRTGWLRRMAEGSLIISDESHLSAGVDSTCGTNLRAMLQTSRWAVHSSATSAKEPKNLSLYAGTDLSLLGNRTDLEALLRKGGAAAMEAIPAMLAEEGQYIRREHDMSGANFVYPEVSEQASPVIREQMDAVSSALRLLMRIQSVVSRMNMAANADVAFAPERGNGVATVGRRLGLSSQHFSSPLHHFTSQVLFALHADFYADQAIEALRRDEKPVFLVKDTLGAVIEEVARELIDEGQVPNGCVFEMTFSEVLERIARRVLTINVNLGPRRQFDMNLMEPLNNAPRAIRGNAYRAIAELMRDTQVELLDLMGAFREALDRIPAALPLSPLDRLRQRLEAEGYRMGELTGRNRRLTEIRPGQYRMEDRENAGVRNRQAIMNAFNSGELDAILINRAGATGVDLHSDLRFADQRRRNMIVCQADDDIYVFQQAMGRVFRANQANFPTYTFPGSAIPVAVRGMSIMRRRLSSMLALTRGSREAEVGDGMPDIFNWVGSEAALNYLRNNPAIAETLGINLMAEEQRALNDGGDTSLANRLTALALLLPCDAQEDLIDGLVREYENRLEDLERRGINPFRSRHMDMKATVVNEIEIFPATGPSVFQSAVVLKELDYGVSIPPLRATGIQALINVGKESLTLRGGANRNWSEYPLQSVMQRIEMNIRDRQASAFDLFLRAQYGSLAEARASDHDTAIVRLEKHHKMFSSIAPRLCLGASINLLLGSDKPVNFHIVEIVPPIRDQDMHIPSDWRLRMISRESHVREVDVPLSTVFADAIEIQKMMLREADPEATEEPVVDLEAIDRFIFGRDMPNLLLENGALNPAVVAEYENSPSGEIRCSRFVLGGNLLRAIAIAGEEHKGLPSTYTLNDGSREYGVIMPANYDGVRLMSRPVELRDPSDLFAYLCRTSERTAGKGLLPLELGNPRAEGVTIPAKEAASTRPSFWLEVRMNHRDGLLEASLVAPRAKNRSGWMVGHKALGELLGEKWERSGSDVSLKVLRVRPNDAAAVEKVEALLDCLLDLGAVPKSSANDKQARRWLCQLYQSRAEERTAGGPLPEQAVCAREM